jgi:hypothetical protein
VLFGVTRAAPPLFGAGDFSTLNHTGAFSTTAMRGWVYNNGLDLHHATEQAMDNDDKNNPRSVEDLVGHQAGTPSGSETLLS